MNDLVGRTLLNRYHIHVLIGRGGMAEVNKAWDSRRQYHVAIKVMREDLAEDLEFLRRFKREAQALAGLSHTNIVRFYSFEREGHLAFIVMDYVEGITLRRRILEAEGKPLSIDEVLSITRQVCAALHYAHGEGVIHRDVKPANIMIQLDGRVLLSDFGIAKAADAATMTTVISGTVPYMSPEQCRGEAVDARTDIYSLGIVIYEMLVGQRPFRGEQARVTGTTGEKVRWEHLNLRPPSPRRCNREISQELEAITLKCLEKNPGDRFASTRELLEALKQAILVKPEPRAPIPVEPVPPTSPSLPEPLPPLTPAAVSQESRSEALPKVFERKRRGRIAAWALFSIGIIAALAMWMLSSNVGINLPEQGESASSQARTALALAALPEVPSTMTPTAKLTQDRAMIDTAVALTLQAQLSLTPKPSHTRTPFLSATVTSAPTTEVAGITTRLTINVSAKETWQSTGVEVQIDDQLRVEWVSGKWSPWPGGFYDGIGFGGDPLCSCNLLKNVSHASLIGKIGNGKGFYVGNEYSRVLTESGELFLGINDNVLKDNSGSIKVNVIVIRSTQ